MTTRDAVLFADRKPTPFLIARWTAEGALMPLPFRAEALEPDLSGRREFRSLWASAFPDRDPLPHGALAQKDGRGSQAFLDALSP